MHPQRERFEGVINANGGKVTKKENWGLRALAYRMHKNRKFCRKLFLLSFGGLPISSTPKSSIEAPNVPFASPSSFNVPPPVILFVPAVVLLHQTGGTALMRKNEDFVPRNHIRHPLFVAGGLITEITASPSRHFLLMTDTVV